MNKNIHPSLPRREQEVLEIVHRLGTASARQVQAELPDGPSYAATRMLLQRLHKKALVKVTQEGSSNLYTPTTQTTAAGRAALERLLGAFFAGSPSKALASLISERRIDQAELAELEALIRDAKQRESE